MANLKFESVATLKPGPIKTEKGYRSNRKSIYRAQIPGGWLVVVEIHSYVSERHVHKTTGSKDIDIEASLGVGAGITFVPDASYKWTL